jgi:hypothetical protein
MIQRDWTEQIDGLTNLARDQQGGIDVAGTDQVGLRQQPTRGEKAVNRCRHRPIRHSRRGCLDIRDQVRPVRLAGFGQMNLVADPAGVLLFGVAGVGSIGDGRIDIDSLLHGVPCLNMPLSPNDQWYQISKLRRRYNAPVLNDGTATLWAVTC